MIKQLKLNAGLADLEWSRFVRTWIIVLGGIMAVTAIVSLDFYQGDEHFQILEFVNYKLNRIPSSLLPWEFQVQMRPWLQPAVYYLMAKIAAKVGIVDPFALAVLYRLLSGFFAWVMVSSMMLLSYRFFSDSSRRRASVYLLSLLCFLPYMLVRTSSDSWSTSFCLLGYALLMLGSKPMEGETRSFPPLLLFLVGLLWGLAFEFRVQSAFMVFGFLLWIFFIAGKRKLASLAGIAILLGGMVITIALGTLADWWGYGSLTFVPWNYFFQNIVNNAAAHFGTLPWWGYFVLVNNNLIAFVTVPLTIGTLIAWVRFPKHSLTWGSLLYFLAHVAVAHKEARFMLMMAVPCTILFIHAWTAKSLREPLVARIGSWRKGLIFKVLLFLNAVGLVYALTKHNVDLQFDEYAYHHLQQPFHVYVLNDSFTAHPFYERDYRTLTKVSSVSDVMVDQNQGQTYLLTAGLDTATPTSDGLRVSYVESSLPAWLKHFDFFHWESKIKAWTLYRVDRL